MWAITKNLSSLRFAEIHSLDAAGVDHRRLQAFVQILGFVDVAEGGVVQRVAHQRTGWLPVSSPSVMVRSAP